MKVYIVTEGQYSDYGVRAVFLSREKAAAYIKANEGKYDDYFIEEYETFDDEIETTQDFLDDVYIKMDVNYDFATGRWFIDSNVADKVEYSCSCPYVKELKNWREPEPHGIYVTLRVRPWDSDEKIIKIAQDAYAKYKAIKDGAQ